MLALKSGRMTLFVQINLAWLVLFNVVERMPRISRFGAVVRTVFLVFKRTRLEYEERRGLFRTAVSFSCLFGVRVWDESLFAAFICIKSQHKTQQETRNYNVAKAKYGKVACALIAGHYKFAGQWELGRILAELGFHVEFASDHIHWIVSFFGGHFDHDVGREDQMGKVDPENVVYD